jgi:hypothetical protein
LISLLDSLASGYGNSLSFIALGAFIGADLAHSTASAPRSETMTSVHPLCPRIAPVCPYSCPENLYQPERGKPGDDSRVDNNSTWVVLAVNKPLSDSATVA